MAARDMIGSEKLSRRGGARLPAAAVLALVLVCASWWAAAAEGAVLAKRNTTFGSCLDCRIAEDLELEMLLVEEVYYATVHVDRMLGDGKDGTPVSDQSKNSEKGACDGKNPGDKKECSPDKTYSQKNCGNQYNRACK